MGDEHSGQECQRGLEKWKWDRGYRLVELSIQQQKGEFWILLHWAIRSRCGGAFSIYITRKSWQMLRLTFKKSMLRRGRERRRQRAADGVSIDYYKKDGWLQQSKTEMKPVLQNWREHFHLGNTWRKQELLLTVMLDGGNPSCDLLFTWIRNTPVVVYDNKTGRTTKQRVMISQLILKERKRFWPLHFFWKVTFSLDYLPKNACSQRQQVDPVGG